MLPATLILPIPVDARPKKTNGGVVQNINLTMPPMKVGTVNGTTTFTTNPALDNSTTTEYTI